MPGKRKKSSKGRKASEASKDRKARKARRGPKNDPITMAAREFLYECPGGMDKNEKRDKFLTVAKRDEQAGEPLYNIVGNVVRAAFFQGKAVAGEQIEHGRTKKRKRGVLTPSDLHLMRVLVRAVGGNLFRRLGSPTGEPDVHEKLLASTLATRLERFDYDEGDPGLWKQELDCIAGDIIDRVLERTQEKFQVIMGASAWQSMGLPQF